MKPPISIFALIVLALSLALSGCSRPAKAASSEKPYVTEFAQATSVSIAPTRLPVQSPSPTTPAAVKPAFSPEDPGGWDLNGSPDPYNTGYMLFPLNGEQQKYALQPVLNFYNWMYHSNKLLTLDQASQIIDISSQAWTDPQAGFKAAYDSFTKVGYYPYFEFPIDDVDHYTDWRVGGVKTPDGQFYVVINFRFEEQGFTVIEQATQKTVVSTPYWGPRLLTFYTAFKNGRWMITYRYDEDLGTKIQPTPTK